MWWTEYIYSYFRIQSWLIITLMVFQIVFPFIIISKLISNLRESERKTGREKERETESNRGGCEWDITDTCPNSHREFILSHHQLIIFLCSLIPHTTDCLMPTSKPHTVPVHFLLCMVSILGQSKEHGVDEESHKLLVTMSNMAADEKALSHPLSLIATDRCQKKPWDDGAISPTEQIQPYWDNCTCRDA